MVGHVVYAHDMQLLRTCPTLRIRRDIGDCLPKCQPDSHEALYYAALVDLYSGAHADAEEKLRRAESSINGSAPAVTVALAQSLYARKDHESAGQLLQSLPRGMKRSSTVKYLNATGLMMAGDGQKAKAKLIELTNDFPSFTDGWLLLARIAYQNQEYGQARERLRRVLDRSPDNTEATMLMAMVEIQLNNPEIAVSLLEKAIVSQPEDVTLHALLARGFDSLNQLEAAKVARSRLQELVETTGNQPLPPVRVSSTDGAWKMRYCSILVDYCAHCLTLRECH